MFKKSQKAGRLALLGLCLLSASVQADPGDEDVRPKTPFAVPELAQYIFSYLPGEDLSSTRLVSQDWKDNADAHCRSVVYQKLNNPFVDAKRVLPGVLVQDVLNTFLEEKGFLVISQKSALADALPQEAVPLSRGDLLTQYNNFAQYKRLSSCYKALFYEDLPLGERVKFAFSHLLAVLPVEGIYLKKDSEKEGAQNFLEKMAVPLQKKLEALSKVSPHMSFSNDISKKQWKALKKTPHTIVITGTQLYKKRDILEKWLSTHPDHEVLLSVNGVLSGMLNFSPHHFPSNLHHLTVVNPEKNVTSIGVNFLYDCRGITTLNLDLPNVTIIERGFMHDCHNLTTLNLHLPNVTSIGRKFLLGCHRLTTLNLNLPNLSSIDHLFLFGCYSLPESEKKKVRDFLAKKGIEWK